MRRATTAEWGASPDEAPPESGQTPETRPDWGDPPAQQPVISPSQTPVYHPHAPLEIPPDSPTTPPLPEHLPIGDPRPAKSDLATSWPRQGVYY
jgi:hypothetical protein